MKGAHLTHREQLGVQCLAQGAGIEPLTLWYMDDCLYQLSYSCPNIVLFKQ
ncbi:hypothetical protein EXN66_Car013959 [Channa argus]|uniref:Uncharacterized protein n=1 Tax=Channa argus TaxID=215402 RepID=A0A6G1Q7M5_CHAAH|nr:hypothetical protein EXN66_Car013959 [Channa argus]